MLSDFLKIKLQYLMPKHFLSRLVGKLAAAKAGWLTTKLISLFIKQYQVNMAEAVQEQASDYATFNDFFTRPLKPSARPVCEQEDALVFPVDGAISQFGKIEQGNIFQAKGHSYSAEALLGGQKELAELFDGGQFMTIYLSPKDYHRIHMPLAGQLTDMLFVPGELFSVNPLTTANVPGLFARNERVVSIFDTDHGKMAMVLVGATIVASIETVWAGTVAPKTNKNVIHTQYSNQEPPPAIGKGDEMGRFKLGSTIVMLYQPNKIQFEGAQPGATTRMGERCGSLIS